MELAANEQSHEGHSVKVHLTTKKCLSLYYGHFAAFVSIFLSCWSRLTPIEKMSYKCGQSTNLDQSFLIIHKNVLMGC